MNDPPDQWPVRLEKAQHSCHGHAPDNRTHPSDLPDDALDELAPVATSDTEAFRARTKHATIHPQLRTLSPVPLRVNDPHTGRPDGDVVDVRARAGDAAVVQHPEAALELGQPGGHKLLSHRALLPRSSALRVVGERKNQAAQLRVRGSNPLFAAVAAPFVLPSGGGAGDPGFGRRVILTRDRRCAIYAANRPGLPLVDRLFTGSELTAAQAARAGIPQLHPLLGGHRL